MKSIRRHSSFVLSVESRRRSVDRAVDLDGGETVVSIGSIHSAAIVWQRERREEFAHAEDLPSSTRFVRSHFPSLSSRRITASSPLFFVFLFVFSCRSTYINRTIASGRAFLAGFFTFDGQIRADGSSLRSPLHLDLFFSQVPSESKCNISPTKTW